MWIASIENRSNHIHTRRLTQNIPADQGRRGKGYPGEVG